MKKVGIVSCYFIHSYGSMLQAYATQKALANLGYQNETINVSGFLPGLRKKQYGYILKSGISSDIFRSRVTRGIALIRKKIMKTSYDRNIAVRDHRFDEFYEKFIKLSGGVLLNIFRVNARRAIAQSSLVSINFDYHRIQLPIITHCALLKQLIR